VLHCFTRLFVEVAHGLVASGAIRRAHLSPEFFEDVIMVVVGGKAGEQVEPGCQQDSLKSFEARISLAVLDGAQGRPATSPPSSPVRLAIVRCAAGLEPLGKQQEWASAGLARDTAPRRPRYRQGGDEPCPYIRSVSDPRRSMGCGEPSSDKRRTELRHNVQTRSSPPPRAHEGDGAHASSSGIGPGV
jgi:hypothetical protein